VLDGHSQRVNAVKFSPDGQSLAYADHKEEVKLWQAGPTGGGACFSNDQAVDKLKQSLSN
jgi:WD40 repeat protein